MMQQFQFEKLNRIQMILGNSQVNSTKRLDTGQGLTIGNTLRRVLLTELEGTAITAVRIMVLTMNLPQSRFR